MTHPEIHQLDAFVAVATALHFGRAANALHVTQSTVSHRIRGLEETVGVTLFDRTGKRVALTAAGRAYLRRVSGVLGELKRAGHDARDAAQGRFTRVVVAYSGALSTTLLGAALAELAAASPTVTIEVQRRSWSEQIAAVAAGEVDIGCSFTPGAAAHPGVVLHRMPARPLYAWVGPGHPLARRRSVTREQLATHRWVTLSERAEAGFSEFLRARGGGGHGAPIEVDALDAALDLVARDVALAIFPDTLVVPPTVRRLALRPKSHATIRLCTRPGPASPVVERLLASAHRG